MADNEEVLVFERKVLEPEGVFQGFTFEVERYLKAIFAPGVLRFMLRSEAETNPEYKQLIPYVIMASSDTYLSYVRGKQAGEKRLVGNRSMGIGGHINPIDENPLFDTDYRGVYTGAVQREVEEEVAVDTAYTDRIVALLNDDSNEVGQVHLGIVHFWDLKHPKISKREKMIAQLAFMSPDELNNVKDTMETWSQLCLDMILAQKDTPLTGVSLDHLFE